MTVIRALPRRFTEVAVARGYPRLDWQRRDWKRGPRLILGLDHLAAYLAGARPACGGAQPPLALPDDLRAVGNGGLDVVHRKT